MSIVRIRLMSPTGSLRPAGLIRSGGPFTFHFSPFTLRLCSVARLLVLLGLLLFSPPTQAAPVAGASYPADPASYHDDDVTSIPAKLWGRVQQEPLNLIATIIFALAITHTFLAAQFQKRSKSFEHRLLRLEAELAEPRAAVPEKSRGHLPLWAQFYHFTSEIDSAFATCRYLPFTPIT